MAVESPAKPGGLVSDSDGYTRLHITPLDPDLLKVVVPAAVLPQARNISYHTLATFPDRRYGFVDLPTADADKLRKKLNGATLKGTKVRIEQARPEAILQPTGTMEDEVKKPSKAKKSKDKKDKSKKRKLEGEVVEGVVIEDRKIKRGWTVTESDKIKEKRKERTKPKEKDSKKDKKDKKKREVKSKYTDSPECLFKQKVPEVASAKNEEDDEEPRRKKRKGDRKVVVHEFEKATKFPTFLKSSNETTSSEPLTFEDGKGWVDAAGNVVERSKSKRPSFSKVKASKKKPTALPPVSDDDTSSSGSSSGSDSEDDETSLESSLPAKAQASTRIASKPAPAPANNDDDTSSSGTSSDESSDESDEEDNMPRVTRANEKRLKIDTQPVTSPTSAVKSESARPKSSGSTTSLTIKIPPTTPAAVKVHPLEALYKRPAGSEPAPDAGFSFFGNEDDMEEEEDEIKSVPIGSQVPLTPYSKQDFEFRNIRSAAPTPDTAHPSRSFNLWPRSGSGEDTVQEEEEEEEEAGEDSAMANITDGKPADKNETKSEFQNWFWEHRGDLNRSWKKRRKIASKEKRNRENRGRAARAI